MDKTNSSKARLILGASVALITAVTTFFILRGVTSAAPNIIAESKTIPSSAPAADCWLLVSSPNPVVLANLLVGVANVGANDVWAVGYYGNNGPYQTLTEHWDGSSWTIVPSPDGGTLDNQLLAVTGVTSSDVWAVGDYEDPNSHVNRTLTEHWNGTTWSVVPSPNPSTNDDQLRGVVAVGSSDVWAVGSDEGKALIERWNGSAWHVVQSSDLNFASAYLVSVAAVTHTNVWAVGGYYDAALEANRTLVEHWNGTTWSVVPSPNVGSYPGELRGIAAVSSSDVWAVGNYSPSPKPYDTLIEHWNGSVWSVVPSPNVGTQADYLIGVAAVSSSDVWAVGWYRNTTGYDQTLIEHWDGSGWSAVASPSTGNGDNLLSGVAVVSSSDVWAVGSSCCSNHTLVERYDTCVSTSTPTLTPTIQPPPCPGERFTDVCPGDYFYTATLALADDGILSGYNTSPPCLNSLWVPCFNPYSSSTRGQISKVVSLAAGFSDEVSGQTFEDVPPGSTFYTYTERMAERGIISGYPCGGVREPCVPPDNRPYFRTNRKVTRGQLSKMTALAFDWNDPPVGQDFEDVPPASTFYTYVAQLYSRSIINGYQCGGAGEPCVPPDNLPYFRPNSNVTRGQTAKIVQLARTQPAPTPTLTTTPDLTSTPTLTATAVSTAPPVTTDTPTPDLTATLTTR